MITTNTDTKIEFVHFMDHIIDDVGEKIEGALPLLQILEKTKKDSPEYIFLNRLWIDWCEFLSN